MKREATAVALALLALSPSAKAQEVSAQEILQKLQALEQKVQELERENRELKAMIARKGIKAPVSAGRKGTTSLKVGGRILFRFTESQSEAYDKFGKTIWGDPSNGFTVRKARLFVAGKVSDDARFKIMIRADKGAPVELWDAKLTYSPDYLPFSVTMGMFKVPLSLSYLKSGTELSLPERPLAVNTLAPVWRDVGVAFNYKPFSGVKLTAAVLNGEGWNDGKIYNEDHKYAYVFAADCKLYDSPGYGVRVRVGYETGTDRSSKMIYTKYNAVSVKRHLIDAETEVAFKDLGLSLMAGYLYDNPTGAKDSNGNPVSLGNAKGYYLQADYGLPFDPKLHLVGRYSWVNPNDQKKDVYDREYTTVGFYYLLHGWQAALRTSYTRAVERHDSVDDNLFTTEFQLLF
jgi:L,D-peptidoglycan transpeptidase YkuD (ErfK/YbiS/YcfS/YnhG family)